MRTVLTIPYHNITNKYKLFQEFLKVCTLQEGDVFGMTSLFSMDSELDTSLVSRGCECVIVNKTTFTRLLDRDSKDVLREKVCKNHEIYLESWGNLKHCHWIQKKSRVKCNISNNLYFNVQIKLHNKAIFGYFSQIRVTTIYLHYLARVWL